MENSTLPTAKEFFMKFKNSHGPDNHHKALLQFAKMHVQAALIAADGEVPLPYSKGVLKCYPESNIK